MNPIKKQELISMMDHARSSFRRLPGPSDDPDELTAYASSYRDVLVRIQMLAGPIVSPQVRRQLDELSVDPNSIYDVYDVKPRLDTLMIDIDEALQALDAAPATTLTKAEIIRLVNHWIGVTSGYLGYPDELRFTYATHDDFWLETCGIVADTYGFEGTTRECFIDTLGRARAEQQADALEAILNRFPGNDPADPERPNLRTPGFEAVIRSWIRRLRSTGGHVAIALASASDAVRAALADAEKLGAPRAVDRVHTAMHSYLHQICADGNITSAGEKPTMARLLKAIRNEHPALADLGPSEIHVTRVLQAMGTILDALNPIRNDSSAAHPMNDILDEPEAELVCNSVRTLLRYLERRFSTGPTDRHWPATGDRLRDEIVVARPQEPASTDGPA